jgi:hypothetical protein
MANQYTVSYNYTDEDLYKLYVEDGLTQQEIADLSGTRQSVVSRHMKKAGIPSRRAAPRNQTGEQNNNWKGGRILQARKAARPGIADGGYWYVYAPEHVNATRAGYVAEHIKVATDAAGVAGLEPGQVVHHVDLDKRNNDPLNLVIVDRRTHANWHVQLERIAVSLMQRGMVAFDPEAGYSLR